VGSFEGRQALALAEAGTKRATGAAELAAMRAFQICDVTGPHASDVNGVYTRTDELKNGNPVFTKVDAGGAWCCWFAPTSKWMVSPTTLKDANKAACAARTQKPGLAHPAVSGEMWMVGDGTRHVAQPRVSVRVLTTSEAVRFGCSSRNSMRLCDVAACSFPQQRCARPVALGIGRL
jgi:hypothetical protein